MKNSMKPTYVNKVQQRKIETNQKKKSLQDSGKSSILKLNIPIKDEVELKKYEIYGELGKGAYGIVKMGVEKNTG